MSLMFIVLIAFLIEASTYLEILKVTIGFVIFFFLYYDMMQYNIKKTKNGVNIERRKEWKLTN